MIMAQTVTVTGTVKDTEGYEVIGATVQVVGVEGVGTTTNLDGQFTLSGIPANSTLRVSYVGMITQDVPLNGQTRVEITLLADSELLDEVVVVGYGTQKKVNLTGSVATVDTKALEARPVQNVGQALQGVVPGLNLSVNNAGGALDSRMSFNIRGAGTIGQGSSASPLVLIDGTEGDLYSLSPSDIESISVLKDASSSAIYGSRAAFGVILITTKSGKGGKMSVSYNGNLRFSTATQVPEMPNSLEFAHYWNYASINSGGGAFFSDDKIQKIKDFIAGTSKPGEESGTFWKGYNNNEPWAMYGESWANTDWFAEMYRKNVPSQEHNISFSGGSDKMNYYISGSILDQNGLIRHGKDKFNRYNFAGKFTANITDWMTITYNNKWVREDYSRPSYMTGLFFHNIARRWPTNPIYDPKGHYVHGNEILQMEDGGKDINQRDYLYQQATIEIRPIEGWLIRAEGNYNTVHNHNHWDVLPIYYHDPDEVLTPAAWSGDYAPGVSNVGESMYKNNYFNVRLYTEYNKTFNEKHEMKLLGGMDMEYNRYTSLGASRKDLITPLVPTINNATNKDTYANFTDNHWATMGFFARANYAYDSRYLAEISIRRDGSSRFIDDQTWGTFPSFSLGWNIANEEFWESLQSTVNTLKLRGSWGALGNTNTHSLYPWFLSQPFWSKGSGWLLNGERQNTSDVPGLVSPFLTWEKVQSWNIGLDFGLFQNRLQGSFDYFARTTVGMVGPAPSKPSILGADQPRVNNSNMRSQGWELELKWRDQVGDFTYGARLVLSDDYQVVTKFYNPNKSLGNWYEGRRNGEIWGFKTDGLASSDEDMQQHLANNRPIWGDRWGGGDLKYLNLVDRTDSDGKELDKGVVNDGSYTLDDHGDLTIIGNSTPRYRFGITLDAAWRGIDFTVFLQGVGKRDFWDNSVYSTGANGNLWQSAAFKDHLDFWRPADDKILGPNLDAYYPRPQFGIGGKNFVVNDRYMQDASYMRIKNLQLGYTLPVEFTQKFAANRVRLYFSADNLYTFTKLNKIFDPEATGGAWGPGKLYPLQRSFSFGLNANF
ncbi:MAG: TonB-dependent receptor [Porphyromonas sp.]|nr:TonB-dependent receptor [Porphyromonas sp.]